MSEAAGAAGTPWDDWIGRSETAEDVIELSPVRRMQATLDDPGAPLGRGDPLPPVWHWMYFLPAVPTAALKRDGLPSGSGLLPPVDLPRRMFGGCSLKFLAPLPIGAEARKESTIVGLNEKRGRSGRLLFLDTRHRVYAGDTLCIEELYTAVFREEGSPSPQPRPLDALPPAPDGAWVRDITVSEPFLFRYSALTFNPHRIHYDRPYATGVEGYGGLVVHGPLLATLLLEVVRRNTVRPVTGFSFRAAAPVYDIAPFRTQGISQDDGTVALSAIGPDGNVAMTATAELG
ncbi:MAG TPA: acyl-CoA dehydrogenase [Alphaproteobacteria bacterium]|jgi:3-methylfumaryl-CoA hydratase|nr:acyl-CoA dehydrogenase [Alphaproteobacteria bacterium]